MPEKKRSYLVIPIGVIVTILIVIFGYTFTCISNVESKVANSEAKIEKVKTDLTGKIETTNTTFVVVQTQLSQIQTDISWIKKELNTKK